jgi:hypothetical protein
MQKFLLLFTLFAGILMGSNAQEKPLTTIAFGSCDNQYIQPKLWKEVNVVKPQLWIWGGDIVYGDTYNMDTLRHKYAVQKNQPGYKELVTYAAVTGVYDDHDYGLNDGGKEYERRRESRDILQMMPPEKEKADTAVGCMVRKENRSRSSTWIPVISVMHLKGKTIPMQRE